ncbi:cytochrome P450 [Aspergillus pseudoustus]|uniref:Cytochrome P450 n=1 Tax=Aspergillus pseudoustus TaxID=1810923 RepID=A0ABR4IML3_9EURO
MRALAVPAASSVLLLLLSIIIYRIYFHPLARFPGPFLARITGYWRTYQYTKGDWDRNILKIHKQYGRVVRIAPNELAIVDEAALRTLYGHGTKALKTQWYSVWDVPETAPQLFSELDRPRHGFLRKRLSSAYSMSSIMKYETYIQTCLDLLWTRLSRAEARSNPVVNMSEWSNALAFDVIGELGYGEPLGHVKADAEDVGGLRGGILSGFILLSCLGYVPGQSFWVNNQLITKISGWFGGPTAFIGFRGWSEKKVQNRLDHLDSSPREDLLSHFCRMKKQNGEPAAFREVLIEAMNLVGAGADTTSIGIRSCLYYTAMHPHVYKRVREEVDQFYRENKLARPISYRETQELPFLKAVVKEATRVLPSIVWQLPRHTPPDFSVRGQKVPQGTTVSISPIAQNHDEEVFGADAAVFRPERWLEDPARAKYMDTCLMTFGGNGPRMCVGRNIALVEMHKFLAQFIHHFDFEIADKSNPWRIKTYWFAYQSDLKMRIRAKPEFPVKQVEE